MPSTFPRRAVASSAAFAIVLVALSCASPAVAANATKHTRTLVVTADAFATDDANTTTTAAATNYTSTAAPNSTGITANATAAPNRTRTIVVVVAPPAAYPGRPTPTASLAAEEEDTTAAAGTPGATANKHTRTIVAPTTGATPTPPRSTKHTRTLVVTDDANTTTAAATNYTNTDAPNSTAFANSTRAANRTRTIVVVAAPPAPMHGGRASPTLSVADVEGAAAQSQGRTADGAAASQSAETEGAAAAVVPVAIGVAAVVAVSAVVAAVVVLVKRSGRGGHVPEAAEAEDAAAPVGAGKLGDVGTSKAGAANTPFGESTTTTATHTDGDSDGDAPPLIHAVVGIEVTPSTAV